jgi:tRNA A37 threonylcarbamoyladenosine synthetase subunit TsaC/SUA5/YrdC
LSEENASDKVRAVTTSGGAARAASIAADAAKVYQVIRAGGVAVIPTDVSYGMIATSDTGVRRIYELKGRPLSKACITVTTEAIYDDVALPLDAATRAWLDDIRVRTPIAIVSPLDPSSRLLANLGDYSRSQATQNGTVATFFSAGALVERVAELAFADDTLVIGSSANTSGTGNNCSFAEIPASIRDGVDIALDRGHVRYANTERLSTTILDVTTGVFVRQGVNYAFIKESWDAFQLRGHVPPSPQDV